MAGYDIAPCLDPKSQVDSKDGLHALDDANKKLNVLEEAHEDALMKVNKDATEDTRPVGEEAERKLNEANKKLEEANKKAEEASKRVKEALAGKP